MKRNNQTIFPFLMIAVCILLAALLEQSNNKLVQQKQTIIELKEELNIITKKAIEAIKETKKLQLEIEELDGEIKRLRQEKNVANTFEAIGTAYTSDCDSGCTGITKTGHNVKDTIYVDGKRVVAVDPNVIPLYSTVKIRTGTDEFLAIALDTGSKIKGNRIDVLVEETKDAINFGKQKVEVTILN